MRSTQMTGLGFVAGCGLGAGGAYIYLAKQRQTSESINGPKVHLAPPHHALKYGVPATSMLREFEGYVALFDYRTRNPQWVIEHLTEEHLAGDGNRSQSNFVEDTSIEERFRSKLADYRGSGYDRGHMAPASNHKHTQAEMDSTFCLTNISPQVGPGFNRDYWARFERFVHELTRNARDVYVVTGPLWLPTQKGEDERWKMEHSLIGSPPGLVSVPTHYYKVVLADGIRSTDGVNRAGGSVGVGAFVMPNAAIDPSTPLSAFTVPLEALEASAGTNFFPQLINERKRSVIDMASHVWREHGLKQVKLFDRQTLVQNMAVLPAPLVGSSAAASTSTPARSTVPVKSGGGAVVPKTAAADGVVHLCEVNACSLPPVDFWKKDKNESGSKKKGKDKDEYKGPKFGKRSILNVFKIFF